MLASPSSSALRGPRQRTFLDMFRTITPHKQHIVLSQSKVVLFRPSIISSLRHRARKINRHRHPTQPTSRQHHDYPRLGQHPRGDQPQPPLPPPSTPPLASTVNDDEISHFSRLSAQWWDERGEFALLHKMNPHRIRFIREKVLEFLQTQPDATTTATANTISSKPTQSVESPRLVEGMDVLDVGCGGGILSEVRSFINPFFLGLLTDVVPFLYCNLLITVIRVSRVSAPIRSPSTRRPRTLASRRVMPLRILVSRTMQRRRRRQRRDWGHSRSGMRLLRRSYRNRSDSMSSVRWRSLNTSITLRAF